MIILESLSSVNNLLKKGYTLPYYCVSLILCLCVMFDMDIPYDIIAIFELVYINYREIIDENFKEEIWSWPETNLILVIHFISGKLELLLQLLNP